MPEEFFPLRVAGDAVLLRRAQRPPPGYERPVPVDGLFGVDGFIAEGDVDVAVPGDDLGDVRREAVHDGVGEEHPAEVVGGVVQRGAGGAGQCGAGQGAGEDLADGGGGDRAVLGADAPLEQHRGGRQPQAFVIVVGGDERHGVAGAADPADDGAEHVGELGADDQQPLGVGFGRDDLQQRHQLAGAGEPVLHEAVVAELDQLLDADAGGAQDLDGCPGPECAVFFCGEVAAFPAGRVAGPDVKGGAGGGRAEQGRSRGGDGVAGPGVAGGLQQGPGVGVLLGGGADQDRQDREPFAGPGVHPRLAVPLGLALDGFRRADGTRNSPWSPPGRVIDGPLGQVEVEGPDRGQELAVADPLGVDHGLGAGGGGNGLRLGAHALFPGVGDLGTEVQAVDAGMVGFQVGPEHAQAAG